MTSQIALFNSLGVAIASDTVTTHTVGQTSKTTSNAEKIYPLGDRHLVAVVHSGAVEMNWTHAGNLITGWSRSLLQPFDSITDYPRSFLDWIDRDVELVHPDSGSAQIKWMLENHFFEVARRVNWVITREDEPVPPADALSLCAQNGLKYLQSLPLFAGATDEQDELLLDSEGVDLAGLLDHCFSTMEGYSDALPVLRASAPLVLSRSQEMPTDAQFGFIGFGENDYFARSVQVDMRGRYGGLTRATVEEPFGAHNARLNGSITTYAQAEAIQAFLRGAHYSLTEEIYTHVWDAVYQVIDPPDDERIADEILATLRAHAAEFQQERFISPMLATISGLPLSGLAELAQSLVGMQAAFSTAGSGPATVGGLIESLVISRAHGVQWVNRLPGALR